MCALLLCFVTKTVLAAPRTSREWSCFTAQQDLKSILRLLGFLGRLGEISSLMTVEHSKLWVL